MKDLDLIDMANLLNVIIVLEHQTDKPVTKDQYASILKLTKYVGAPPPLEKYFARKAKTE